MAQVIQSITTYVYANVAEELSSDPREAAMRMAAIFKATLTGNSLALNGVLEYSIDAQNNSSNGAGNFQGNALWIAPTVLDGIKPIAVYQAGVYIGSGVQGDAFDSLPEYYAAMRASLIDDGVAPDINSVTVESKFLSTVAAGCTFASGATPAQFVAGDTFTLLGVTFIAVPTVADIPYNNDFGQYFALDAPLSGVRNFINVLNDHPALAGKFCVSISDDSRGGLPGSSYRLAVASAYGTPPQPFTCSVNSSTVVIDYVTPGWVDALSNQVDPIFGTPLCIFSATTTFNNPGLFNYVPRWDSTDNDTSPEALVGLYPTRESTLLSGAGGAGINVYVSTDVDAPYPDTYYVFTINVDTGQETNQVLENPFWEPLARDVSGFGAKLYRIIQSCLSGTNTARVTGIAINNPTYSQTIVWSLTP